MENLKIRPIHSYKREELPALCDALREYIRDTVLQCGGHLSSNLGAIESTLALFYAFDFPKDKIIFDVGHQCYAYKLLSGRAEQFHTLRKKDGLSGFPKRNESVYDCYDTGHAGTSISAALGMAKARDLRGGDETIIAYIGDGSFNNGLVYEALNSLSELNTKILIILNDNGMSISPTVGGMHAILSELRHQATAEKIRLLESYGLTYIGVRDGNDVDKMLDAIEESKQALKNQSVLLHIVTTKGKGYSFSEDDPVETHGVAAPDAMAETEYGEVLGKSLCRLADKNNKIAVVCAAMKEPLGLSQFFKNHPERAFDVGICEENAAVLCAGLAVGGMKPYYAVYSTFLQRAFDEIIHDVCAQDLPVTFCVDRAGISGADGETHQGVFDLSYLSMIPNLTIAIPKDTREFEKMLEFSASYMHPLAIRYPRSCKTVFSSIDTPIEVGTWEYLHHAEHAKIAVIGVGERCLSIIMQSIAPFLNNGQAIDVINARFSKPFDIELLQNSAYDHIITLEDNVFIGGFGAGLSAALMKIGKQCTVRNFAYRDAFIPQGSVSELQSEYGVSAQDLTKYLMEICK